MAQKVATEPGTFTVEGPRAFACRSLGEEERRSESMASYVTWHDQDAGSVRNDTPASWSISNVDFNSKEGGIIPDLSIGVQS